jgi:hypothetical protein
MRPVPHARGGAGLAALLWCAAAGAQELEPRAYSPNPTGANFLVLGVTRSTGEVVFDPTLPFRDVEAEINAGTLFYGRTFGLFGRSASAAVGLPYILGYMEGQVAEEFREIRRSGLGDARARLAVNLIGGPALAPREFAARKPSTTLGASILAIAPTGQYDPAKLVNIGANRWSLKTEVGLSHPVRQWTFELYAGVWYFGSNDDFYGGVTRDQDPLGALQVHVAYTFRSRLWLAGNATYYTGGSTTVNGVDNDDTQNNTRVGVTLSLPLRRKNSLKLAWANSLTHRLGGKFNTLSIGWQHLWL